MLLFGLVGLIDDVLKVRRKRSLGLRPGQKMALQICLAAVVGLVFIWMGLNGDFSLRLTFPFFKQWLPFLAGSTCLDRLHPGRSSNAVNLADGLDGLAIGLTLISVSALTALTYVAGNINWSNYLSIAYMPMAAELTVFTGALAGACLGFLWFNCHPAQVFMAMSGRSPSAGPWP